MQRFGAACTSLVAAVATADSPTQITVDWSSVVRPLKTVAGFQTVVNPFTTRQSPIHDQVYDSIATLGASYQRFVPWLPYPKLGIAELEPPSTGVLCGFVNSGGNNNPWTATIDCAGRGLGTISSITFASYGTPTGYCGSLTRNPSCDAPNAAQVVSAMCVGKPNCTVASNDQTFGKAPCAGSRLAIEATCSGGSASTVYTYWDFSWADQGMVDFLNAAGAGNRSTIPNFSTIPSWLFVRSDRDYYPDDPLGETWSYEAGGNQFRDPTLKELGDYYGRLVAHYVEGGFTDEAGRFIPGYNYNISIWEVLNEIEGEHSMSPETYTQVYDAIVSGIKRWAPKGSANMKFMALALEDSGNSQYVQYVLNASNHAPSVPLPDFVSFHHYASASARDGGDAQGTAYDAFFSSADAWLNDVTTIMAIRDKMSPATMLDADEVGVILPDDNDAVWTSSNPGFPNSYWNAAAASYAYLFGITSVVGLDVLGESQLVGYPSTNITRPAPYNGIWTAPPQYPSVAMLNWTDGSGTARYWVLKMLVDEMKAGAPAGPYSPAEADVLVTTTIGSSAANPFCGTIINLATLQLACEDPSAVINAIQFASYGTPTGTCGNYAVGSCNAPNSTAIVSSYCLNKNNCSVPATTPIFGDPCYGTVKNLVVQATCSSGGGGQVGAGPIYAQAFVEAAGSGQRKVLFVNKVGTPQAITLPGATGGSLTFVDPSTAFGPPATTTVSSDTFTLGAFSVAILRLN